MKKIILGLLSLAVFSCTSQTVEESRVPANQEDAGPKAYICKAVCEIYFANTGVPNEIKLQVGMFSVANTLAVTSASTMDEAIEMLKNKCAEPAYKTRKRALYNVYKTRNIDLSTQSQDLGGGSQYDMSVKLNSSNKSEFCELGTVTEYIEYLSQKPIDPKKLKTRLTHDNSSVIGE